MGASGLSIAAEQVQDAPAPPAAEPAPAVAPSRGPEQDAAPSNGEVIEGAVNPYTFEPVDPASGNANAVRNLLEAMGEDAIEWFQHVQTLSNPFFEGRAPGSRGSELTHEYVEFWMKKAGLEPAFPGEPGSQSWTSYRQSWMLPGGAVEVVGAGVTIGDRTLERGVGFEVMGNSGAGTVVAPLGFAGYAIEGGPDGYESFDEGADLSGRIAVMLRYEPLDDAGHSRWTERRFSEHSAISRKIASLMRRNPAAVILVNPPGAIDGRTGLESTGTSAFGATIEVPFIQLSQDEADRLLTSADPQGRGLMELRKAADSGSQRSFNMRDDVTVAIHADVRQGGTMASNIGGVVRGRGALANEWVIVGAHLDHVGYGEFGTQPRYRGQLHPGADDNASGTGALLVLARRVAEWAKSSEAPPEMRSFLFIGFDAEESGLRGSREYTRNPTLSLDSINVMINMDMVGRLRNDELTVAGVGTAEGFLDRLRPTFEASGLKVHADPSGRGPSDHASFHAVGVPVLFLFTGSHREYHRPTDRGHTVNPAGAVRVIDLADALSRQLATDPRKLVFSSATQIAGRDRGYARVRLGIQPGMNEGSDHGVKVEAVSEGTSAADAGIEPGDILLAWNGTLLEGTANMMEQLRNHQPGDVVTLKVQRGERTLEIDVTLKASQARPRPE